VRVPLGPNTNLPPSNQMAPRRESTAVVQPADGKTGASGVNHKVASIVLPTPTLERIPEPDGSEREKDPPEKTQSETADGNRGTVGNSAEKLAPKRGALPEDKAKNRDASAQSVQRPQKVLDHETDQGHVSANEENQRDKRTSQKDPLTRDKPKKVKRPKSNQAQETKAEENIMWKYLSAQEDGQAVLDIHTKRVYYLEPIFGHPARSTKGLPYVWRPSRGQYAYHISLDTAEKVLLSQLSGGC
jgi:hypothetical protein